MRVLVVERERFHRFLAARLGDATVADDLLQDSLLVALRKGGTLRRGERVVAWFYRILRRAIVDHYRRQARDRLRLDRLGKELQATESDRTSPPPDWEAVVCACFVGLLPTLNPRYADVLRRMDLRSGRKASVARELNLTVATLDVVLHRARAQLRERLEVFCGACSREGCLNCACEVREHRRTEKV